jgi:DnaJ-class molecular chaperone
MPDHYTLLNISPFSSREAIEGSFLAFRARLNAYAPGIDTGDESLQRAFPEIWKAYQVLLDANSRQDYDKSIGIAAPPAAGEALNQENAPGGSDEAGVLPRLRYFVKGLIFFLLTATILYAFISLFGAL